jgi:hypothetical protein
VISFAHPSFLLALPAIAVPIIIHMSRSSTATRVQFPATPLLMGSAQVVARRRSFIERVLLAVRILLVVAAIITFARPRLLSAKPGAREKRLASIAIVLDDTPSMGARYRNASGRATRETRMGQAKLVVEELLAGLQRGSRIRLQTATRLVCDAAIDPDEVRKELARLEPSDESPTLERALADAEDWIAREPPPDRALYVISDFQSSTWREAGSAWLGPGVPVRGIDVGSDAVDDWSITAVSTTEDRSYRGVPIELKATVTSGRGGSAAVRLVVGGDVVSQRMVSLVSNETTEVAFEMVPTHTGPLLGEINVDRDDDWAQNNSRAFALTVLAAPRVLVVSSPAGDGKLAGAIVSRVLAPYVGGEHEIARVSLSVPPLPSEAELARLGCVVLTSPGALSQEDWSRLARFVEQGGGLLALADESVAVTNFWSRGGALLPVVSARVRIPGTPATLDAMEYDHPALRAFRDGANGDVTKLRFDRFLQLALPSRRGAPAKALALFVSDRATSPALVEGRHGRGRIMVFAANVTASWGTLYREATIVPLMHELVSYLARSEPAMTPAVVGDRPILHVPPGELGASAALYALPRGTAPLRQLDIAEERLLLPVGRLDERRTYGVLTSSASAERMRAIVVELAPHESARERTPPSGSLGLTAESSNSLAGFRAQLAADLGGVDVYTWPLTVAVLCFVVEVVLSALLTRKRSYAPGQAGNTRGAI